MGTRELDLLHEAQAAWRARDINKTLSLLDEHGRLYARSELRDERSALRILALCELGRTDDAGRLGRALIRRAPSSPVRATIEESCAIP
jgi:RNA polymerase sigma-70 factor (ECF subfamily)